MPETPDTLYGLIKKIGDVILGSNGAPVTASQPMYVDSASKLATGGFPFAVPLISGTVDTSFSAMAITGASTNTANDIFHQTLVDGASVTTFTKTGFIRVTVTDSAGNITSGAHYIQVGSLS